LKINATSEPFGALFLALQYLQFARPFSADKNAYLGLISPRILRVFKIGHNNDFFFQSNSAD